MLPGDSCLICGEKIQENGYCTNKHLHLRADLIRKHYKLFDKFTGPMGGNYSLWISEDIGVCLHDDDDEIVSVVNIQTGKYLFISEKTKTGLTILQGDHGWGKTRRNVVK